MSTLSQNRSGAWRNSEHSLPNALLLLALAAFAFVLMGYHPGLEDDSFYLAAIKWRLDPPLFPHDADFFRVQFQATLYDKLIAFSIRLTHLPVAWVVLLWQMVDSIFSADGTGMNGWVFLPRWQFCFL